MSVSEKCNVQGEFHVWNSKKFSEDDLIVNKKYWLDVRAKSTTGYIFFFLFFIIEAKASNYVVCFRRQRCYVEKISETSQRP